MYAVVKTGGKQYRVTPNEVIRVELLPAEAGATVELTEVLMVGGDSPVVGSPLVAGAKVTAKAVTEVGGTAEVVELDVTDDAARRRVVADLFARHGDRFDLLVNVAGIDRPGYVTDIDLADYRMVHAVNCEGPVFLTSEFLKTVQHRPAGTTADVVHVTSLSAVTSGSGAIAYNSSKAAFRSATRCIQRELLFFELRREQGLWA